MYKFIIILLFLFVCITVNSQEPVTFGEEVEPVHYFLGYRIIPTYSSPIQFAIIYAPQGEPEEIKIISQNTFVAYATGTTKCDANPKKQNFFEVYAIADSTVNQLWKLRYKKYPFKQEYSELNPGWSTNDSFPSMPSEKQFLILNQFGITKISDFCYGDNAFRLLKSIEQSDWIEIYKAAF